MIKNAKQALKAANYFMTYDYAGDNIATVTASFRQGLVYQFKYSNGTLSNTYDNYKIKVPLYAALPFVELCTHKICEEFGYGSEFLHHTIRGAPVYLMRFGDFDDPLDIERMEMMYDIYKDIWHFGVKPEHVSLAREADVYPGFQKLVNTYLGVKIGT